jgi:gliding motility-associated-like protein
VVFGTHASHNQASDNSYINGPVTKMGDTAFEFPLGHNTKYRSIAIEAPGGASDSYLAQYFPYNSDTEYPHTQKAGNIELIDTQEYWRVTRMQDDDFVRISIGWDTSLTSDELLQNPDLIHIVRWDTDQALWIDEGGVVDTVNNRVTTLLPISGSGIFTLARVKGDLILPGNVTVFNYISPNDNGENDFFLIKGIAQHPNNQLTIYNRWGNQVYQVQGYNESDRVFRGFSNGDFTLSKGDGLPTGTYFYVLEYEYVTNSTPQSYRTAGYLYIN